jgi:ornithine carbamoyltransferase
VRKVKKDFLSILDLETDDIYDLIEKTHQLKKESVVGGEKPLAGKTLAMIFTKSSTRTRVSFEVGMYQLGGYPLFLSANDIQLRRGETVSDTARVLSRYVDGIMIRTFAQDDVDELGRHATIPVINGLTDLLHPCQVLADLFTIHEIRGGFDDVKVAYVGDGNNVANSWINASTRLPIRLDIACPEGYEPDRAIFDRAVKQVGNRVRILRDPVQAVREADVIYTDVWTSMGQEAESAARKKAFLPYQINTKLLEACESGSVMHCLPAHRGEEITDEVIDGPRSVVFQQAENRLHAQKAILVRLMGKV